MRISTIGQRSIRNGRQKPGYFLLMIFMMGMVSGFGPLIALDPGLASTLEVKALRAALLLMAIFSAWGAYIFGAVLLAAMGRKAPGIEIEADEGGHNATGEVSG